MKKIAIIIVMMAVAMPAILAQEVERNTAGEKQRRNPGEVQTLFDRNSGHGGYGALTVGYTMINGRPHVDETDHGEW